MTRRIASPLSEIKDAYEVVVIGSGYGGGIAASRLARAGREVCLLERGREIIPGEYPDTEHEILEELQMDFPGGRIGKHTAMFDINVEPQQNVVRGCGLGGTSLINANVSLKPEPEVFADASWPQALQADLETRLEEGYQRATEMLKPNPYPESAPALRKTAAHFKSGKHLGAKTYKTPINVTFERPVGGVNHVGVEQDACNFCGDCVSGCNVKAKNTTLMNYLPDAWNHGASIFCEARVSHLEKEGDGGWLVHYEPVGAGRGKFNAPTLTVRAEIVVVSAGTLGTAEIMLRSKQRGLSLSDQVGEKFSGNGDILGFAYNNDESINGVGYGDHKDVPPVGPCITSIIDMREGDDWRKRMIIEEGSIPGALGPLLPAGMAAAAKALGQDTDSGLVDRGREELRELNSFLRGPYRGAIKNTQTYLIMSHDDRSGRLRLDENGSIRVDWPGVGTQPNVEIGNQRLKKATEALGGTFVPNPIWSDLMKHAIVTVHPLGGAVMGEDASEGVVDHKGRVFSGTQGTAVHEGLYITDGSVIPTSLAINPLFTISAVSERNMKLLAEDRGWTIDYTLPSVPKRKEAVHKVGIQFTERMSGFISMNVIDDPGRDLDKYKAAAAVGKTEASTLSFTLTMTTNDLDAMIDEPDHKAEMMGSVEANRLSPFPMMEMDGVFKLFEKAVDSVNTRQMDYQLKMVTREGKTYFLRGFKVIQDDPKHLDAFEIWPDTSTLYVTVFDGDDSSGAVVGAGVLRINPSDFAKQMTTMRVLNATSVAERLKNLVRFGEFFAGSLWQTYGGVAAGPHYFDREAAPRKKRMLRAPIPQVYPVTTDDGVNLRLTRYQGGTKGPVMLVHGLGVSSEIFSTDTIPTNMVEYLSNHGFDVWNLDFRVSINLASASGAWTGDDCAKYDFPAAIAKIRAETGASDVQCVVHCFGSGSFFMSLLGGLEGVRSVVASQVSLDMVSPLATQIKTGLHVPEILDGLGIDSLTAYVDKQSNWFEKLYDKGMALNALSQAQGQCGSPVCHRITFMYGSLYRHETLNETLHENLHELFGEANIKALEHLATMARKGHTVDAKGANVYLPHLERLKLPICFIGGSKNACYLPESQARSHQRLVDAFGQENYEYHLIQDYGHIDCIYGKDASRDVFPIILKHLDTHTRDHL